MFIFKSRLSFLTTFTAGLAVIAIAVATFLSSISTRSVAGEPTVKAGLAKVPTEDDQRKAEKVVREVYDDSFKQAISDEQLLELSFRLWMLARDTKKDDAGRYVLYGEARKLAIRGGGLELALAITDNMAGEFDLKGIDGKLEFATSVANEQRTAAANAEFSSSAIRIANKLAKEEDFEDALQFAYLALTFAKNSNVKGKEQLVIDRGTEIRKAKEKFAPIQSARILLTQQPEDPAANLVVGKYLCFQKADWRHGLLLLAKGADEKLKSIAQQDLANPVNGGEMVKIADDWAAIGNSIPEGKSVALRRRTLDWYRRALPLLTGPAQTAVADSVKQLSAKLPNDSTSNNVSDVFLVRPDHFTHAEELGATPKSQIAVLAALSWLARHQSPDGSWGIDSFTKQCKGGQCGGAGSHKADAAGTALGLLPFLAAGQTHLSKGPYQTKINSAVRWLITHQKPDGDLSAGAGGNCRMYSHGLATVAICECYGLSEDSQVRSAAQKAIRFIEDAQDCGGPQMLDSFSG